LLLMNTSIQALLARSASIQSLLSAHYSRLNRRLRLQSHQTNRPPIAAIDRPLKKYKKTSERFIDPV